MAVKLKQGNLALALVLALGLTGYGHGDGVRRTVRALEAQYERRKTFCR
jgi:hypothetical protein